jgi:hypothetical protein
VKSQDDGFAQVGRQLLQAGFQTAHILRPDHVMLKEKGDRFNFTANIPPISLDKP